MMDSDVRTYLQGLTNEVRALERTVSGLARVDDVWRLLSNGNVYTMSGHVGVGDPAPTYEGDFYDSAGSCVVRITSETDDALLILDSNQDGVGTEESGVRLVDNGVIKWRMRKDASNDFQIYNDNLATLAVEIDTGTNRFGIGAAPVFKFDVYEDRSGTFAARVWNDGNNDDRDGLTIWAGAYVDPACEFVRFCDGNGGYIGKVEGDGDGTLSYVSASDARRKNVLGPIDPVLAMEALANITPIRFEGLGSRRQNVGFSAQAVRQYFPEVASYDEEIDVHSLDYAGVTPILWAQNQVLLERLDQQQVLIDQLIARVEALEK